MMQLRIDGQADLQLEEFRYTPGRRMPAHRHGRTGISLVVSGGLEETALGGTIRPRALEVVVKPAGTVHADRFGPEGAHLLSLALDGRDPALGPYAWYRGGEIGRRALALFRELREPAGNDPVRPVQQALERLLAAIRSYPRPRPDDNPPPPWLGGALRLLEQDAPLSLRVRDLAGRVGVHPVHLARSFQRFLGKSPRELLRQQRACEAAHLIASTTEALCQVATAAGFADQAHLCRVFRRETGMTPGAFRELVRS